MESIKRAAERYADLKGLPGEDTPKSAATPVKLEASRRAVLERKARLIPRSPRLKEVRHGKLTRTTS